MGGYFSPALRWLFGRFAGVSPIGGGVCATVAVSARVSGTVSMAPRVNATVSVSPRVNGTVTVEAC